MKVFNKLLERQIRRNLGSKEEVPAEFMELLQVVSNSYDHYERDRKLIERAMELSSEELRKNYEQLTIQAELKRANKELQQFAHTVSHDLKSPLRNIRGFSQLIDRRLKTYNDKELKEYTEFIIDGVDRMQSLIDGLLSFAEVGKKFEQESPIKLGTIIEIIKKNVQFELNELNAKIVVLTPMPTIYALPSQMFQLFQNLISNALKFRREEPTIIAISSALVGEQHLISVKDNGIGIAIEHQEKVFGVFKKLHPKHKYEGSGLGLSICKKIVENNGGEIWLESTPNVGTTFFIKLNKSEVLHNETIPEKVNQ